MEKYIFWAGCGRMGRDFTKNAVFLHWAQKRAAIFYQSFARTWFLPGGRASTIKPSQASKIKGPRGGPRRCRKAAHHIGYKLEERKEFWNEEREIFPPQLPEGRRCRLGGQPGGCQCRRRLGRRAQGCRPGERPV